MKAHWAALGVGLVIGGALAFFATSKGAIAPFGDRTRFNLKK